MRRTLRFLCLTVVFLPYGLCAVLWADDTRQFIAPGTSTQDAHAKQTETLTSCPPPVVTLAEQRQSYALQLAERGALCSAKEELMDALWLITQSHDQTFQTSVHRAALDRAIRALDEAEDFTTFLGRRRNRDSLRRVISSHRTKVVIDDVHTMPTIELLRQYLSVAETSFLSALRHEPIASQIVYGLGRVEELAAQQSEKANRWSAAKKIMLYRVAHNIDSGNVSAANELAVQLGRFGRWEDARDVLLGTASANAPKPTWRNLATIYSKLGENHLATQATQYSEESVTPKPPIRWVTPATFTSQLDTDVTIQRQITASAKPASAAPTPQPKTNAGFSWAKRFIFPTNRVRGSK